MADEQFSEHLKLYDSVRHDLNIFMRGIVQYLGEHPQLQNSTHPVIHSYKSRLKDREHLRTKLTRKQALGENVEPPDLFRKITDLAGVRILHLYQEDFAPIDQVIRKKVKDGDWFLSEKPKAFTWDPESAAFFRCFDLGVSEKSTLYTSVHYLVRPRSDSLLCCEVQVRTLFEEIWGEIDHQINYPKPTESVACREQLRVLSKIVGAGSRLLDSLRRVETANQSLSITHPSSAPQ